MQRSLEALLPAVFLISASFLQAQTPFIQSANNAASYDSTAIAQGSMMVIFGDFLGPSMIVSAPQLPLTNTLAGTTVTVESGGMTLNCPLFYTSSGQVAAVLPSNTPVGIGRVSVTYNNNASGNMAAINVVATSVGMFTPSSTGIGIGIFTDALTGAHITSSNPATPGELLTGWATGVGPLIGADNQVPSSFPNFPSVQVWLGGQSAQMSYAGRSGCCVAVDQLNFYVPKTAIAGCTVPVIVTSSGRSSNTTTIPIGTAGVPCSDSGLGFPPGVLTSALAGNPVRFGFFVVALSRTSAAHQERQTVADQLSAALHVKVSVEDADRVMRALESHDTRALKSAMSKYARQWRALSPRTKAHLADTVGVGQQVKALALFGAATNEGLAAAAVTAALPPPGSCVLTPSPLPAGPLGATAQGLDAGASVSVVGAAGSITLPKKTVGDYEVVNQNSSVTTGNIPVGTYTISAPGGKDIGAFSSTVNFASHPSFTNTSALATIDRSQAATVTWTGGISGKFALILGYSGNDDTGLPPDIATAKRGFVCSTDSGAGTFTIPSYILSAMWPTPDNSGALVIAADPRSEEISIPGLDVAWFVDLSTGLVNVIFK
jgi:uncharacterized protein (TIGR03437 family)